MGKNDYVNNKAFVVALVEYREACEIAEARGEEAPPVSDYIALCIFEIANRQCRRANFANYTFREEMVGDGIYDCMKAVRNFDVTAETRKGTPNAFGYFSQICYFASVRRINKEKHQTDIKESIISCGNLSDYAEFDNDGRANAMVEKMRTRRDAFFDPLKSNTAYDSVKKPKRGPGRPRKKKISDTTNTLVDE